METRWWRAWAVLIGTSERKIDGFGRVAFNLRRVEDLLIWLAGSHCYVKGKNSVLLSHVFSQEKKDSELCGLDSELGSLEKGKLLLGKKIKQERDGNYNIQGADSRFILSE